MIMEMEIGVVGGEEDGVVGEINGSCTPTPRGRVAAPRRSGRRARPYILAATFGNVHGVYKPGNVNLRPRS